jgi:hypothetical protein
MTQPNEPTAPEHTCASKPVAAGYGPCLACEAERAASVPAADALDRIRERCEKATEGPWETDERYPARVYCDDVVGSCVADCNMSHALNLTSDDFKANADFIAHAREDVPYLLAALTAQADEASTAELRAFAFRCRELERALLRIAYETTALVGSLRDIAKEALGPVADETLAEYAATLIDGRG